MTLTSKANFLNNNRTIKVLAGLLISAASLYAPTINAAPIYKVVDSKTGQVTFTDRPQSYEQQSDKQVSQIGVTTGNSNSPNTSANNSATQTATSSQNSSVGVGVGVGVGATLNAQTVTGLPEMKASERVVNYQLAIIEPADERAYRRPAQNIVIQAQVKPALQVGDSASIYLDGEFVALGLSASIATVDILPGEHSVQVMVKNKQGQIVQQVSHTIYVIQNTVTIQKNKKLAEQLLAYERLPWYQKVLLKMRQEGITPNMEAFTKPTANTPTTLEQPVIK